MTATETLRWYQSHESLVELAHHLHDEHSYDAEMLLAFFGQPWNYETEWVNFIADRDDPYVEAVYLSPAADQAGADDYLDSIREYAATGCPGPEGINRLRDATSFDSDGRWYFRLDARRSAHQPIALRFGLTGWPT